MFTLKTQNELAEMTEEQVNKYQADYDAHKTATMKQEVSNEVKSATNDLKDFLGEEIKGQIAEMTKNAPEFKHLKQLVKDNFETIKDNIKKGNAQDLFVVKAPQIHRTDNDVVTFDDSVNFEAGDNVINDS